MGGVIEDILGAYFFRVPEVHLYWTVIGLVAGVLGITAESLTVVVATHELAHAYSHLGRDIDGKQWETEAFARADLNIVEGIAQFYTEVVSRKLETRNPPVLPAYKKLTDIQQGPYRVHEEWAKRKSGDKEDREFGSVLSTCSTALSLYSDPLVVRNTEASDFRINDLVNHDLPVSLYLVVPPADKIRLRPLMRLMFTMVVNRLTEKMVFERSEQQHNKHRLLLLIDEFPSLNRMEIFADALSYMAGYGIQAYRVPSQRVSR